VRVRDGLTWPARRAKPAVEMAIDIRPVVHVIGLMLMAFGTVMLFPAALDLSGGLPDWRAFVTSGIAALFVGGCMALATADAPVRGLDVRQAFVLTVGIWVSLSLFGALPFMLGPPDLSFTDAVFEAVSGTTTTGSTVIVGLDALPPGINLWRGMLNWIGGLALFNLTSVLTGTGFFSGSYGAGGPFAMVVALVLGMIGGCSRSGPRWAISATAMGRWRRRRRHSAISTIPRSGS